MKIINNFIKYTTAAAVIAATGGCVKKPYREMPKDLIPNVVKQKVDSLKIESEKTLKDTTYKCYGKDTLHLSLMDGCGATNVKELQEQLNDIAKRSDKRFVESSYTYMMPISNGKTTTLYPQIGYNYADVHINQKAIVKDAKIFTTDSIDMYVPVEYYGQINPKYKKLNKPD